MEQSDEISINQKMNSDRNLLGYKNDIEIATYGLKNNITTYIAGALITKYKNRIEITFSGFDPKFKHFNANYFLHYNIIELISNRNIEIFDEFGTIGDVHTTNKLIGLHEFKKKFGGEYTEFIGEFDFIINEKAYNHLTKRGLLAKEFNKN